MLRPAEMRPCDRLDAAATDPARRAEDAARIAFGGFSPEPSAPESAVPLLLALALSAVAGFGLALLALGWPA